MQECTKVLEAHQQRVTDLQQTLLDAQERSEIKKAEKIRKQAVLRATMSRALISCKKNK